MAVKKAPKSTSCFVVAMSHSGEYYQYHKVALTKTAAVEVAHAFFLSYGFEIREGRAYGDDGLAGFHDVKIVKGKIAEFLHCGGQGPSCRIYKTLIVDMPVAP